MIYYKKIWKIKFKIQNMKVYVYKFVKKYLYIYSIILFLIFLNNLFIKKYEKWALLLNCES